ncbi:TonB-dependent receptor [Parapedobacter defluvii]|uniref:SusC/RagA family TonB-linked outer membrane protein n=1 Tax=Parapedobacter defluvii TaxID=2045106 RepID=UPI003341E689
MLRTIKKQTDLAVVYNDRFVNPNRKVSIHVENAPLTSALESLLSPLSLTYHITESTIVIVALKSENISLATVAKSLESTIQERMISGKVTDEGGHPLEGVTVAVKGTSTASTTNAAGEYQITISDRESVLVFTTVGYEGVERTVANQSVVDVALKFSISDLEEVVVVGYGTQRKKDLTGAVSTVSGSSLANNSAPSAGQALQGKIAGLQVRQTSGGPGAGVEIRIRGWGTFGADAFPLVVVDGIITSGGLNDIDPSNIEDITILKDASSAAIYGSRGANGVVLVTTKRGKAGKATIDFDSYYSLDNVIHKIPTVDAATYGSMVNDFYVNDGKSAPYSDPASLGKGTNWQDEIFRTGTKQNYSLSLSGGTEKSLHAVALSYYDGEGVVVNTRYRRYNFRVNNDLTPLKGLKFGSSIGVSAGGAKEGNPTEAISRALIYAPNVKPYNEDGSYGIADMAGQPTTMSQPLVAAYERNNSDKRLRALGNLYAEYEMIDGLKFRSNLGVEYINFDGTYFTPSYNFGLGNSNGIAVLNRNTNNTLNWMVDNILTYNKTFNENHHVDLLAGHTFQYEKYEFLNAYRDDFSRNDEHLQVLDAATANDRARGSYTEWALQSYLGRVNYSYKSKYLFTSNLRIDQSSRFAKDSRTGVFPSFSLGWVLSEEDFLNGRLGPLSYLKLRTGYGLLGNQAIGIYPYQSIINSDVFYDLGTSQNVVPGAAPTALANRDIRWEKTATTGVGVEFNLFENKLGFIIDYYNRRTSDILVVVPLPALSGLTGNPYQNVASVRNNGIEFTVNYANSNKKGDFSYHIGANLTVNKNEVTKLNEGLDIILAGGGQGGVETRTTQGRGINSFFGHVHDGIFQTKEEVENSPTQPNAQPGDIKFKDLNNDGVINADDRTFLGNFMAKQTVGLNAGIKYHGFDLNIAVTGDFGRTQNIFAPGFAAARAAEATNAMWADRWTGSGTSSYVPRIVGGDPNGNSRSSDFWVRKQDYIRIQNVQLGYDISSKLFDSAGLRKVRIYVAAQNLATFTDWPGYDPELTATGYPLSRSIFFGINLGI